ncbi:glycosyltransferase family 9 protein [bacterium]|nr:glycosyltransferase family 9 protein [bacterium]
MKFLIIKPSSLGDVACAMPVVALIKERYPDASVDWLVNKEYAGLAKAAGADRVLVIDRQAWKKISSWPKALFNYLNVAAKLPFQHYDYTIDLQGLLRSGIFTALSNAKKAIGFADGRECSPIFYDTKVTVNRKLTHSTLCNLEVLKEIGIEKKEKWPSFAPADTQSTLEKFGLRKKGFFIAVPLTRWKSKNWVPEFIAEVGRELKARHGWQGVLVGGNDAKEVCAMITRIAPDVFIDLAGKTDWSQFLALSAEAVCAVTPDTGPMHVMAAAGTPMIAVMGPTDPRRHGPYGDCSKVLQSKRRCLPCYHRDCVLGEEDKPSLCMADITPEMVLEAVEELLKELNYKEENA